MGRQAAAIGLRIEPARVPDTDAVLAMLGRCSRTSLRHRFHGPTDGVAYTSAQLRRPGDIVLLAWEGDRCVGMAVIALDGAGGADLGALVEDGRQRRGIGTGLIQAAVTEARRRGVRSLHADIMGDDGHLVRSLRRLGPARVAICAGIFEVDVDLAPENIS